MKTLLTLIALTVVCANYAQEGYMALDGGYTKDLNFSFSTLGMVGRAVGEAEYFYSNHKEIFSASVGAMPLKEDRWKMIVVFGTEINNGWKPRMSTELWHRVGQGDGWLKLGVQTVNADPYVNFGLAIGLHSRKSKPTRFF